MANALYDAGRDAFLNGNLDWVNDTMDIQFVDEADYTVDLANDDFFDDVTAGGRVGTSTEITSRSTSAGTADGADTTVSSVSGDEFESIVIYNDAGGAESADALVANIDTATGLPFTPSGGDIQVTWDSGSDKIFTL